MPADGTPATAPTIDNVSVTSDPGTDETYGLGDTIEVEVTFDQAVTVTGTPQITLRVGGDAAVILKLANYASGTGTTTLRFTYVVQMEDEDTNGIYIEADELFLNSGTIQNTSGVDATLTYPRQGQYDGHKVDGSLAPDTTPPRLVGTLIPSRGDFIALFFNERLSSTTAGTGAFAVTVAGNTRGVSSASGGNDSVNLVLRCPVLEGEAVSVSYTDPTAGDDQHAIQDEAGNDAASFTTTVDNRSGVTEPPPDDDGCDDDGGGGGDGGGGDGGGGDGGGGDGGGGDGGGGDGGGGDGGGGDGGGGDGGGGDGGGGDGGDGGGGGGGDGGGGGGDDGGGGEPQSQHPDLVVGSPSVTDDSPAPGATFTLSATVRNDGEGDAAATTLRVYRSTDQAITTADTEEGTDAVAGLAAAGSYRGSVELTAPSTAGTYYYGACVDAVADESDLTNNCSASVPVTVPDPVPALPLLGHLLLALGLTGAGVRLMHRRQRVPPGA